MFLKLLYVYFVSIFHLVCSCWQLGTGKHFHISYSVIFFLIFSFLLTYSRFVCLYLYLFGWCAVVGCQAQATTFIFLPPGKHPPVQNTCIYDLELSHFCLTKSPSVHNMCIYDMLFCISAPENPSQFTILVFMACHFCNYEIISCHLYVTFFCVSQFVFCAHCCVEGRQLYYSPPLLHCLSL